MERKKMNKKSVCAVLIFSLIINFSSLWAQGGPDRNSHGEKSASMGREKPGNPQRGAKPKKNSMHDHGDRGKRIQYINYRGERRAQSAEKLKIINSTANFNGKSVIIKICFNESINPTSFINTSIKINGKILDDEKIYFSKDCRSVQFETNQIENPVHIKIENIEAFERKEKQTFEQTILIQNLFK